MYRKDAITKVMDCLTFGLYFSSRSLLKPSWILESPSRHTDLTYERTIIIFLCINLQLGSAFYFKVFWREEFLPWRPHSCRDCSEHFSMKVCMQNIPCLGTYLGHLKKQKFLAIVLYWARFCWHGQNDIKQSAIA